MRGAKGSNGRKVEKSKVPKIARSGSSRGQKFVTEVCAGPKSPKFQKVVLFRPAKFSVAVPSVNLWKHRNSPPSSLERHSALRNFGQRRGQVQGKFLSLLIFEGHKGICEIKFRDKDKFESKRACTNVGSVQVSRVPREFPSQKSARKSPAAGRATGNPNSV